MILFENRPDFAAAWAATKFRVVMGGMGDDTAMLIAEMYVRGYEPDEIVFCDTGSEFRHTYEFIEHLKQWCEARSWSKVVVLKKTDKQGKPLSVIGTAEQANDLPSAAFGSKSCSLRFKVETADKYFNNHPGCWDAWGVTGKGKPLDSHTGSILRIVGINGDEINRIRNWKPEHKWCQVFPLVDWDVGEKESTAVDDVGLYYPGKSACICCPHMNGKELYLLSVIYPEDFQRIKTLEANYQATKMTPESQTIGLCRHKTIEQKMAEYTSKGIVRGEGGCSVCDIQ
jgi:3'-phosphoadenosine 5'-phosphosulfate sulfotransferase (PAPS reductase)/FAD synthetase